MAEFDLQLGEYFLHVLVEETTALHSRDDGVMEVQLAASAMGASKRSQPRRNVAASSSTFWGNHFYFSRKYQLAEALESEELHVSVYDRRKLLRDALIGTAFVSLASVYQEREHTVRNRWYVLQNKAADYQQVMGYVRLSLNLAFASDPRVVSAHQTRLEPDQSLKLGQLTAVSLPPEIKIEKKQLTIKVYRAKHLVPMDSVSKKSDPYVLFNFGDQLIRTEHRSNTLHPGSLP